MRKTLFLEKLKDGEEEVSYALISYGENTRILCKIASFQNPDGLDYHFRYTDSKGKTSIYKGLSRETREEASDLMKRLLTQKAEWMEKGQGTKFELVEIP